MKASTRIKLLGAALLVGMTAVPSFAQDAAGGGGGQPGGGQQNNGGGGGGGGGGRRNGGGFGGQGGGNFNPQQFQQQRLDRIKQDLGATDEEFAALQPKIEAVMTAQRNSGMGFGGRGGGGRGGQGGPGGGGPGGAGGQPQSEVQKAAQALRDVLQNKDATPGDIKSKLDGLREARTKSHDDLVKAQNDLKGVLTQRQEAVLVSQNILE